MPECKSVLEESIAQDKIKKGALDEGIAAIEASQKARAEGPMSLADDFVNDEAALYTKDGIVREIDKMSKEPLAGVAAGVAAGLAGIMKINTPKPTWVLCTGVKTFIEDEYPDGVKWDGKE